MKTLDFNDSDQLEFFQEAKDLLETAETALVKYSKSHENFEYTYNQVFRAFHSIKGAASMLALNDLKEHLHKIETDLSKLKNNKDLTSDEINYFLTAIDASMNYFESNHIKFDYNLNTNNPDTTNKISVPNDKRMTKQDAPIVYAIDDEPDILDILKDILNQDKIECKTFLKANELYEAIKSKSPNVVLTDMQMPDLTGLQVLSEVKKIDPELPVIFISGYLTKDILIKGITEDGIFAAIEKPFDNDKTVLIVRKAIKQNQLSKLLDKTLNVLMYQMPDLCEFLKNMEKTDLERTLREEVQSLIKLRRTLKENK